MKTYADALDRIRDVVGPKGWIDNEGDMAPYLIEPRGLYQGACAGIARPASTDEVSRIVAICSDTGLGITPQSGNTGLVGGNVPMFSEQDGIIVSTERMTTIRDIDVANRTMTVEAGVILADVQTAADDAGALFPLSLAAEGSCRIGGNLATNAGGVQVLRYGNARDMVLRLEVVLPDGRVWDGLKGLRKDNTGYDMKHLFVGSEGTLGIITAAVLKLFPKPTTREVCICGAADASAIMELFSRINGVLGDSITAFELFNRFAVEITAAHIPGVRDPLDDAHGQYALIEVAGQSAGLKEQLEATLGIALQDGIIDDAVIAASGAQGDELWRLRESIPEAQKLVGGSIKHDVAVAVSKVPEFLERATKMVEAEMPGIRICAFGHAGDGNIHFNLSQPEGMDAEAYLGKWGHFNRLVHDLIDTMGGSFSAEHGIGQLKIGDLERYKSEVEIDLMRTLKTALDPKGIMNPGKVLPPSA